MDKHEMTQETYDALAAEIQRLETVDRAKIVDDIAVARAFGDLKENAEYHSAKDAQGHLETRILSLRDQLRGAVIVAGKEGGDGIGFGSRVDLHDEDTGKDVTYELVSQREADPAAGRVSIASPLGIALRGLSQGEVAEVPTPRGKRRLRIVSIG